MQEFVTAARDTFEAEPQSEITFMHDDREVTFFEPASGQLAIMMAFGRGKITPMQASTFITLFFSMMDDETKMYFEDRLLDPKDPFDLDTQGGVFDLWEGLTKEWSARPTREPSDYQPPQRATGRASTASTRAKASTSSPSRSRASSR